MPQHITITEYSPLWKTLYENEAELVRRILGSNCIAVHHIGSTAVPGLCAKPVIDIMPVVTDLDAVDSIKTQFEAAGYEYLGEFGITGRRYLRKGGDERTHQIHIFRDTDRENILRHLAVRNYLRTDKNAAQQYGRLKTFLAEKYPYSIENYCIGKENFVRELEITALACLRRIRAGIIRPMEPTDLQEIMKIWLQANIDSHPFISPEFWRRHICEVKKDIASAEVFVYSINNAICGFIGMQDDYIAGLFVKTHSQGCGTGTALLEKAKTVKNKLRLSVYEKNHSAVNFYRNNGFSVYSDNVETETGECELSMHWEYKK